MCFHWRTTLMLLGTNWRRIQVPPLASCLLQRLPFNCSVIRQNVYFQIIKEPGWARFERAVPCLGLLFTRCLRPLSHHPIFGERGIRTPRPIAGSSVFKTEAFTNSASSPYWALVCSFPQNPPTRVGRTILMLQAHVFIVVCVKLAAPPELESGLQTPKDCVLTDYTTALYD